MMKAWFYTFPGVELKGSGVVCAKGEVDRNKMVEAELSSIGLWKPEARFLNIKFEEIDLNTPNCVTIWDGDY